MLSSICRLGSIWCLPSLPDNQYTRANQIFIYKCISSDPKRVTRSRVPVPTQKGTGSRSQSPVRLKGVMGSRLLDSEKKDAAQNSVSLNSATLAVTRSTRLASGSKASRLQSWTRSSTLIFLMNKND